MMNSHWEQKPPEEAQKAKEAVEKMLPSSHIGNHDEIAGAALYLACRYLWSFSSRGGGLDRRLGVSTHLSSLKLHCYEDHLTSPGWATSRNGFLIKTRLIIRFIFFC